MKHLKTISKNTLASYVSKRKGETKVGEKLNLYFPDVSLEETLQKYVLLGIPEDIGVRANYGRVGAAKGFLACLSQLCNMQYHSGSPWDQVLLLGMLDCVALQTTSTEITAPTALDTLVKKLDEMVSSIIAQCVAAGKIPIIIGGGHNNSFGNIKGTSTALQQPINCLNIDPHADYRPLEHRHSGNGFSYAKKEGFLNNYHVYGLQPLYNSAYIMEQFAKEKTLAFTSFDAIQASDAVSLEALQRDIEQSLCQTPFGLEIDLDAIQMMGSSAMSAIGFTIQETRALITRFSALDTCTYIHLCEGAPALELFPNQVGRALAYMVYDVLQK